MARQKREIPGTSEKLLTPAELAQAHRPDAEAMAATAAIDAAVSAGAAMGSAQALLFIGRVSQKALLAAFERMRATEAWKYMQIPQPDGTAVQCKDIYEACKAAFGVSYQKLHELAQLERTLGEELLADAQRIGLRRDDLRVLKALPAPAREKVRAEIADGRDAKTVIAIIEDLAGELEASRKVAERAQTAADALAEANRKLRDELRARKAHELDAATQARLAMRESCAAQTMEITTAIATLDELLNEARAQDMHVHWETWSAIARGVALAQRALTRLVGVHALIDPDEVPEDIFSSSPQAPETRQ